MFCPRCGTENHDANFCRSCQTNLAVIARFLTRKDAAARRSQFFSRTGLVSITISEGFAWTLSALFSFVLIIVLATAFLPDPADTQNSPWIASAVVVALFIFCGVPLLLGLVLLLKDLTYVRGKGKEE